MCQLGCCSCQDSVFSDFLCLVNFLNFWLDLRSGTESVTWASVIMSHIGIETWEGLIIIIKIYAWKCTKCKVNLNSIFLAVNMSFQMTKLISYNKNLWNWRKSFARHFTKIINNKNENTMSHISGRGMWEINDIIFVAFSFYFPLVQLANGKYAFLKTLHKLIDCFGTVHYDLINCYFLFNLEYFFVITLLYFPLIFLSEKCVRFLEA